MPSHRPVGPCYVVIGYVVIAFAYRGARNGVYACRRERVPLQRSVEGMPVNTRRAKKVLRPQVLTARAIVGLKPTL
jgi:hypothetical protein